MKNWLIRCALYLYPRAWRERYHEELAATIEDMPNAGWGTAWDLGRGAIAMQIHRNGRNAMKMVMLFGLAGLLIAGVGSFAIRDQYHSMAAIKIAEGVGEETVHGGVQRALDRQQLQRLLDQHRLFPGDPNALDEFAKHVKVESPQRLRNGTSAIRVGFQYPDRIVALRVTMEITGSILREIAGSSLLDGASLPQQPVLPNRPVVAFIGMLGGALLGALWLLLRRFLRPATPPPAA